jgi:hypothetical protein
LPSELPAETRQWLWARVTPDLLKTRILPIQPLGPGAAIPTTYIRCTIGYDPASEMNSPEDARIRSEPAMPAR